jgi:16S rRNA (guanine1207-N2)-methyltransferase
MGRAQDAALDTLFLPLHTGALSWPHQGRVLFVRARAGVVLHRFARDQLVCEQSFRPYADTLARDGFTATAMADERFPLVLVLPPRQRDEARALFAQALQRVTPAGVVVASALNNEGARSGEADLALLTGAIHCLSKNKCRVFWRDSPQGAIDRDLVAEWALLDAPRAIADGRFLSRPGLFAWDRVDAASALLAQSLPADLAGLGADLGAGYGYLSAEVLARCPGVVALDLYEAESRALELARTNLGSPETNAINANVKLDFLWHDVGAGLSRSYDFIVSNPPFHLGRADMPALGRSFIAAAAGALKPGGRFWLVANRHLPYEAALAERFASVRVVVEAAGFKVIEARKANA